MKRIRLKLLLIAACLLLFTVAFAACRQDVLTREELYAEGYTCDVIFDLNGGTSGSGDRARTELHQYVKPDSPIVKPGDDRFSGTVPVRDGYTLGGYYRGTKGEDGTVTYGTKWDFAKDKVTESVTLYAYWRENYSLVVHYGEGFTNTTSIAIDQNEDGEVQPIAAPAVSGHTVIAYYATKAQAEAHEEASALKFPYTPTDEFAQSATWEIWADAIEGTYKLVRKASDFTLTASTNVYLMNNIDLAGATINLPGSYMGTFCGNGYEISNFTVERESVAKGGDDYLGLFNNIMSGAKIDNVTFKNFTLKIKAENKQVSHYYVGAMAGRVYENATLNKVTLIGTVEYDIAGQMDGAPDVNADFGEQREGAIVTQCDWSGVTLTKATKAAS